MSVQQKYLKDENGNIFSPITSASSVILGGGSVEDKLSDTGWINLPLENGFEQFTSTHETGMYRVIGNEVFLKGCIKYTKGTLSNMLIAIIPKKYAPTKHLIFQQYVQDKIIASIIIYGKVNDADAGKLIFRDSIPQNNYFILDGISWFID